MSIKYDINYEDGECWSSDDEICFFRLNSLHESDIRDDGIESITYYPNICCKNEGRFLRYLKRKFSYADIDEDTGVVTVPANIPAPAMMAPLVCARFLHEYSSSINEFNRLTDMGFDEDLSFIACQMVATGLCIDRDKESFVCRKWEWRLRVQQDAHTWLPDGDELTLDNLFFFAASESAPIYDASPYNKALNYKISTYLLNIHKPKRYSPRLNELLARGFEGESKEDAFNSVMTELSRLYEEYKQRVAEEKK